MNADQVHRAGEAQFKLRRFIMNADQVHRALAQLRVGMESVVAFARVQIAVHQKTEGRPATRRRRVARVPHLLSLVLVTLMALQAFGGVTSAMPRDPIDRDPGSYTPPVNGFTWSVPNRFGNIGANGLIDYHWDSNANNYYSSYVQPTQFPVGFFGCRTETDAVSATPSDYTYAWTEVIGSSSVSLSSANVCQFLYPGFASQGAHVVRMTARNLSTGAQSTYTQTVTIKDRLIVSIGDSYGSGEGTPDVPQQISNGQVTQLAKWEDERCHRSAKAAAAQAALALESEDPKSSVTFISFACSGATISTEMYDGTESKPLGSGIMGPYRGAVYGGDYDRANFLPAQLDALKQVVGDRQIDALIISAGGNDIGFGSIVGLCVEYDDCPNTLVDSYYVQSDRYGAPLRTRVYVSLDNLRWRFDLLASAIHDPASPRHLNVSNVLVTEYHNPTKDDGGNTCGTILSDIAGGFWGLFYNINSDESNWATSEVIDPLNNTIRAAVDRQVALGRPWRYVTNIASAFIGPTGHGYCASNHWINTATESMNAQGPFPSVLGGDEEVEAKKHTRGTLHPNAGGQQLIKDRLLSTLHAVLP